MILDAGTAQKHTHRSRPAASKGQIHVSAAAEPRLAGLRMRSRAPGELPGAGSTVRKEMTSHWWEIFFFGNCAVDLRVNPQELLRVTAGGHLHMTHAQRPQDPPPGDSAGLFFKLISVFTFGRLGSSLLCAGFLRLNGGYSSLKSAGFSSRWRLSSPSSGTQASAAAALRLSNCGSRAQGALVWGSCRARTRYWQADC